MKVLAPLAAALSLALSAASAPLDASLSLELSAGSATPAEATPTRQSISPSVLAEILHYANYSSTYIKAPCKQPPPGATVQGFANNDTTQTGVTLFRHDATAELILAFPGSASIRDFITDFSFAHVAFPGCTNCTVHKGFYRAWRSIAPATRALVDAAQAAYPAYTLAITGHSLGGALTNLAFADLVSAGYAVRAAHSFGEPRVGDQRYADYIDRLAGASDTAAGIFRRVTHANDGVPRLPPRFLGFQHHRTEFWADTGSFGKKSPEGRVFECAGQEDQACNDGTLGVGINVAHLNYPGIKLLGCGL